MDTHDTLGHGDRAASSLGLLRRRLFVALVEPPLGEMDESVETELFESEVCKAENFSGQSPRYPTKPLSGRQRGERKDSKPIKREESG